MKHAQNMGSIWATSVVVGTLTFSMTACTHRSVTAEAASSSQPAQMIVSLEAVQLEPRYFGEQYAAQQLALLGKADETPVESF